MSMFSSKKGESLVEVVVALGIFSFVFFGVVNIVAGSITLNMSARQRTEAVAMVQKNLNEYLAGNTNQGACSIDSRPVTPSPITGKDKNNNDCTNTDALTQNGQTCYWIELATLSEDSDPAINETDGDLNLGLINENFIKVISHGKWYTRIIGEQEFQVSRIIRND